MTSDQIEDLDPGDTLRAVEDALARRRRAEVEDLELVCHWADLHAEDPKPLDRLRRGEPARFAFEDRLIRVGGDGTPPVQELSLHELAVARRTHALSTRAALADALDLRHRLPRTWALVRAGACEPWVARRVAAMSRVLDRFHIGLVDDAVAEAIAGESPGRVLELAAGKIIEADPEGYAARLHARLRRRFVSLSRTDDHGLRHVIAHVEAGAATWIDALVDRIADALDLRRQADPSFLPELPEDARRDELRAVAFGWLAHPEKVLALLEDPAGDAQAALDDGSVPDDLPDDQPATAKPSAGSGARAVVYVHLSEAALAQHGVARVEDLGPMLAEQLTRMLRHARVELRPVLDLADQIRVNAYEHPETVKARTHLRCVGEVFPHATRVSRRVDIDHPDPYRHDGTPGQTGDHNAAPLSRTAHRAKTHLGYQLHQLDLGTYLWRTPHGLYRLVNHTGTSPLDDDVGDELLQIAVGDRPAPARR
jgi:hypothetical protein